MRQTFTLKIELRGDMRGREQRQVAEQIQAFAENQDIQTFSNDDIGVYTFKAHPDLINEQEDKYKVGVFGDTLESWLMLHQGVDTFNLQPVTELSDSSPKISSGQSQQPEDNLINKDIFLESKYLFDSNT